MFEWFEDEGGLKPPFVFQSLTVLIFWPGIFGFC